MFPFPNMLPSIIPTTWDALHKTANVTLSNSDRTAAQTVAGLGAARGTRSHSSGKYHFEITCTNGGWVHGLCNASHTLTNTLGVTADNNSIEYQSDGKIYSNNVVLATGLDTFGVGDVLAFEADITTQELWVQKLGGTGRKGPYAHAISGALFPACNLNGSPEAATFNGGGAVAFSISPSSGFSPWDAA